MRTLITILFTVFTMNVLLAQEPETDAPLRIVFQLTDKDTTVHKGLMRQLGNIIAARPDVQIQVVVHGPGIAMLTQNGSTVADKVAGFTRKGIVFQACENTMKAKQLAKTDMLPHLGYVEAGIIHIVEQQDKGWRYIKAGF